MTARAPARATALAIVAAVALASCSKQDEPERFGRDLVMSASMSAEDVERFNAFVPEKPKPGGGVDLLADTEKWLAPTKIRISATANPYVVAIRIGGQVTGDAGATTLWLGGFERYQKPDGGAFIQTKPIAGLNAPAPKPGEKTDGRFERAAASGGVSFRDDEDVRPVVELQRRAGMTLERVDVEVWSGLTNPTWIQWLLSWQSVLVGLVMLVLWWFWFRRRGLPA